MDDEAEDPAGRALALLSCLSSRAHWRGSELTARLHVSARTVRRDVERLRRLGYAIESTPGTEGGYRLRGGDVPPPLFLDQDEAVAVITALVLAAGGESSALERAALGALAKVRLVIPPAVRGAADAVAAISLQGFTSPSRTVDPGVLAALAECCRDHQAVRFGYRDRAGQATERRADPHHLVTVPSGWYLVAYDLDRDDWRTFRIDRIEGAVRPTGHAVTPRDVPHGDPVHYVGVSIAQARFEFEATVTLGVGRTAALAAAPTLLASRVESHGQRACVVRLAATDLPTLVRQLVDVTAAGPIRRLDASPDVAAELAAIGATLRTVLPA